ncbi:MAG: (d)CMP kinase [Actinomycetota bacterium]|nr:(d)CMP kinase [Actinomycetota bacterium]
MTVDGPSGSGKTSLLLALERRYDCLAVEVGPIVRTVAWWADRHRLSIDDTIAALARRHGLGQVVIGKPGSPQLAASEMEVAGLPMRQRVFSGALGPAITATAGNPLALLWIEQLVRAELRGWPAVVSGRQAASRLVPDAAFKLQLTADRGVRADRKARQLVAAGLRPIWHDDARLLLDLRPDQALLDTTTMTAAQVLETVSALIDQRLVWRRLPSPGQRLVGGAPTGIGPISRAQSLMLGSATGYGRRAGVL